MLNLMMAYVAAGSNNPSGRNRRQTGNELLLLSFSGLLSCLLACSLVYRGREVLLREREVLLRGREALLRERETLLRGRETLLNFRGATLSERLRLSKVYCFLKVGGFLEVRVVAWGMQPVSCNLRPST